MIAIDPQTGKPLILTKPPGVVSINGDTAPAQEITSGTSGSDVNVATADGITTVNVPTASSTKRGALSSDDHTLFSTYPVDNGDGSDGNATITGGTTLIRTMYYNNVTISNNATVNAGGYFIFHKGTFTIGSGCTVHKNGTNGGNGSGVSGGGGGAAITGTEAGNSTAGTQGGVGTTGAGAQATAPTNVNHSSGGAGGDGGAGGQAGNGTAGGAARTGATNTLPKYIKRVTTHMIWGASAVICGAGGAGGGSGGGDGASSGGGAGGGGGGGGFLGIIGDTLNNQGTISANGGNGGNGASANANAGGGGGGGGGGAGWIYIIQRALTGSGFGTITANGGLKGTGGSGGGTGSSGSDGMPGTTGTIVKYLTSTKTWS